MNRSFHKPSNGKFFVGIAVGAPGDIFRDVRPKIRKEFGIDLQTHWCATRKEGVGTRFPPGTEVVVMFVDHLNHGDSRSATEMAKNAGLPYAIVGRKRSAWFTGLQKVGFEPNPAWAALVEEEPVAKKPEKKRALPLDRVSDAIKKEVEDATDAPTETLSLEVPTATTSVIDARTDVLKYLFLSGGQAFSQMVSAVKKHPLAVMRMSTANLLHDGLIIERSNRKLELLSDVYSNIKAGRQVKLGPLDPRLNAIPLKNVTVRDFLKTQHPTDIFMAYENTDMMLRVSPEYARDIRLSLDGFEATTAVGEKLFKVRVPWGAVYAVVGPTATQTWPESGMLIPGRQPHNSPLPEKQQVKPMVAAALTAAGTASAAATAAASFISPTPVPALPDFENLKKTSVAPPAPVVANAIDPKERFFREILDPPAHFQKEAVEAVFKVLSERGESLSITRLCQITKLKAGYVRWALCKLVNANRIKLDGNDETSDGLTIEVVLPTATTEPDNTTAPEETFPEPAKISAPPSEALDKDALNSDDLLLANLVNVRDRIVRMGKRQRLMERILTKIFVDLGGKREDIDRLIAELDAEEMQK